MSCSYTSIDSKYSLSRKSLKIIFIANSVSSLFILCLIYFPFKGKSAFDFVYNCLTATKLMSISIWILNIIPALAGCPPNYNHSSSKIISLLKRGVFMYISSILLIYFITVLYGAPLTETVSETFHFALVLATASVVPGLIHLGVKADTWVRIFAMNRPETAMERVVQFTTVSSIVGGWLGAVPIPLDWDRPWQVWPVTCVLGTLLGYVAGLMSSSLYLSYQYYRLNKLKST